MDKGTRKETKKKLLQGEEFLPVNRKFKSRIFEMIFSNKKELLGLYNAVSGKHYTDPELLEINTLKNVIYMGMYNDVSFVIDFRVSLYEHQSTYNPNIPLRCLLYISDLYSGMTKDANLYGQTPIKLPAPQFLVFYNGEEEQPDRTVLKLSDLYHKTEEEIPVSLDLEVVMLNINPGHNQELLDACKTLADYSEYTARVRRYAKEMVLEEAVERAITECIKEGILADFLSRKRAEAKSMSIYEYDEEKHMRQEREENFQKGFQEGRKDGIQEGISKLINTCRELGIEQEKVISQLVKRYSLSIEEAEQYVEQYWR